MEFNGFRELISHTAKVMAETDAVLHEGLEAVTAKLLKDTRATMGVYQSGEGPFSDWAALAPATKQDRVARGFTADEPLLRTGELRDSYYKQVQGLEGGVGSDLDKALGMEIGDPIKRVPARSTLGLTFAKTEKRLFERFGLPIDALYITGAVSRLYSSMITRRG